MTDAPEGPESAESAESHAVHDVPGARKGPDGASRPGEAATEPSGPRAPGADGPGAAVADVGAGGRSGPPRGSTAPPRRRDPLDAMAMLRTLREEITAVRNAITDQTEQAEADRRQVNADREQVNADREKARTDRANVNYAIGVVSELLPRFDTFEQQMTEVLARTAPPETPEDEAEAAEPDTPPITPAIGWDDMDHDTARAAWEALARFVGDVLHGRYRLKRQQVPDCWPLHPRLIRELAWLRSSYLDAAAMEPDLPPASAPWHTRALPPFLANMLDAVDARECRPGIHRLTEHEATAHVTRLVEARRAGEPAPPVTDETGVDRARFAPEAFPTRGTAPEATGSTSGVPNPPTVQGLPDLIAGSCEPRWWLGYYHEASAADLAQRRPTPPRPSRPARPAGPPPGATTHGAAPGEAGGAQDTPTTGDSDPGASAGEVPSRFDLDNDPDDLPTGGPGGTGTGGPGRLGGLDGPAGPL